MTASQAYSGCPAALAAAERERLIMEHLPQVWLIARRIHGKLPESVILEDLVSTGTIGLIAAIDHFDPAQGVKLKTYAEYKIRGAILDSLRGLDWASRQKRKKAKDLEAGVAAAEQKLGRAGAEEEIAAVMGIPLEEYQRRLSEVHGLDLSYGFEDAEGRDRLRNASSGDEWLPSRDLERAELEQVLAAGIGGIPEIERTVLSLYYLEEMTLREIGGILHLHESRISHLKSQAILRLRAYMVRMWPQRGEV